MSLLESSQVHGLSPYVRSNCTTRREDRQGPALTPQAKSSSRTRALLTLEQNTCQYLLSLPDSWPRSMCLLVTCRVFQRQVQLDKLALFYKVFCIYDHCRTHILYIVPVSLTLPPPCLFSVYTDLFNLNPCIPQKTGCAA